MHHLTLEVLDDKVLKALENMEQKATIRIVEHLTSYSPALPGEPMSLSNFRNWVHQAEQTSTVSLQQAKTRWADQRSFTEKG